MEAPEKATAEDLFRLAGIVKILVDRVAALEDRLQSLAETNNLWDGS